MAYLKQAQRKTRIMSYQVAKETRNFSVVLWNGQDISIDECQSLYDDGFRPIFAEMRDDKLQLLCEKVDIYGLRGLQ